MPGTNSSRLVQKNPAQEAEVNASCSTLLKNVERVCVYFVYFLLGTSRPKGVKGTQAVQSLRSLLSGPAFPMGSPIYLKPEPFLFPPLSLY